mmetsp:Transcript_45869/g.55664  ORF Transcript_45869/g.55664 Transcript_45869/m.55664 type:complete len:93 (+) Transcript_45869:90-368(+)
MIPLARSVLNAERRDLRPLDVMMLFLCVYHTMLGEEERRMVNNRWAQNEVPIFFICFLLDPRYADVAVEMLMEFDRTGGLFQSRNIRAGIAA